MKSAANIWPPEHRVLDRDVARYDAATSGLPTDEVAYSWPSGVTPQLGEEVIELLRATTQASPVVGFGTTISDTEANAYIGELRDNLAAGKWRLLTIRADEGTLIGLCTLRRNLNPNNRHLADLCKGMIAEKYRGGMVMPAGFYEIALQCERDGVDVVTLDVRIDAPARSLWERFGFVPYGRLDDYSRVNGRSFAGLYMAQPVNKLKARALRALSSKTSSSARNLEAP